ncbi:MAG TPA: type VII secretion protein EccB [Streptosporangiaceae bacterium]|nr:type VII secretion protein EccB [Streptosporangiaceae bacterium]
MTMQSRRDLLQAHRLMTQRAALALLRGEPDVPDQPLRRLNVAVFASVLVAVIVTVLFFIWGLIGHGGSPLLDRPGTLVIDNQTGTPFVFCKHHELCPVVNYASARLALDSTSPDQQTVSQSALAKFRRGPLIGIPGLPQPLPDSSLLVRQPWSVCTVQRTTASGTHAVTALAGGIAVNGRPLGNSALVARALGQDWVIWNGQRMAIQPALLPALNAAQLVAQVPAVWLNALPEGPAFAPPAIPHQGRTVSGPAGTRVKVGQVFQVSEVVGTRYYVMLDDGLAPITQLQAQLIAFEGGGPGRATLSSSKVSGHLSAVKVPGGGLPAGIPSVTTPRPVLPLCVVYSAAGGSLTRQVEIGGHLPREGVPTRAPGDIGQVALPPGAGALVGEDPGTGPDPGVISYFLVADGRRFALASTRVAGVLGYRLSQAVLLPGGVVRLIPQGPALDPAQAAKPARTGG